MANKILKVTSEEEAEPKTESVTAKTATASATPDPFDPERWRRKAEGNAPKVSKLLTTVPVWMKPSDDKFEVVGEVLQHRQQRFRFAGPQSRVLAR